MGICCQNKNIINPIPIKPEFKNTEKIIHEVLEETSKLEKIKDNITERLNDKYQIVNQASNKIRDSNRKFTHNPQIKRDSDFKRERKKKRSKSLLKWDALDFNLLNDEMINIRKRRKSQI